jgi:curli biogenesis system outer membrane secretion channel CsgG
MKLPSLIIGALLIVSSAFGQEKAEIRLAVLPFENQSFFDSKALEMFVTSMMETSVITTFDVQALDREMVMEFREQYRADAGNFSDYMTELHKNLDIDYIISGAITEFGIKTTGTKVSARASERSSGLGGGTSFQSGNGTARIAIDLKIIDVSNGNIILKDFKTGEATAKNSVFGFEFLAGRLSTSLDIEGGLIGFDETLGGQASRDAVNQLIERIKSENLFYLK